MHGVIYLITNTVNGKRYVGQTVRTLRERWQRHCWPSNSARMPVAAAIAKYGKERFTVEIIAKASSQEELNRLEIQYVQTLNTLSPAGYNLRAGEGRGKTSPEFGAKISRALTGRKASEETRRRLSESHKGKKMPEATRKRLRQFYRGRTVSLLGPAASRLKSVKTYFLVDPEGREVTVVNMREHCLSNNLMPSKMSLVANKKRNHHKGWKLAP